MKKKAMIMAVASLGSMALIGTGFAGWVISANAEIKANGTITAYDVKDQRLVVTKGTWTTPVDGTTDPSGAIIFGAATAEDQGKVTNAWFTMDGMKEEVLENTYSFTVKSGKDDTRTLSIVPTLAVYSTYVKEGNSGNVVSTEYTAAIAENAFIAPQEFVVTGNDVKLTGESAISCSVKIAFKWGTKFGGVNPYVYYNGEGKSPAKDGNAAIEDLAKINALNNQTFVLSVAISAN